jgi:cation transport ATPase
VTWLRVVLAAWVILAASLPAYAAAANRDLERIPFNLGFLVVIATVLVVIGNRPMLMASDRRLRAVRRIKFIFGMPLC